jgi:hypothetical protein
MRFAALLFALFCVATARADIPQEVPQSAYFFTSCNQIVMVLIRMPDGSDLVFDSSSQESADAVKEFAAGSKKPARVYEMGCYKTEDRTRV